MSSKIYWLNIWISEKSGAHVHYRIAKEAFLTREFTQNGAPDPSLTPFFWKSRPPSSSAIEWPVFVRRDTDFFIKDMHFGNREWHFFIPDNTLPSSGYAARTPCWTTLGTLTGSQDHCVCWLCQLCEGTLDSWCLCLWAAQKAESSFFCDRWVSWLLRVLPLGLVISQETW